MPLDDVFLLVVVLEKGGRGEGGREGAEGKGGREGNKGKWKHKPMHVLPPSENYNSDTTDQTTCPRRTSPSPRS